ncbi:lysozyme inhibitor LprI family protein [Cohnella mopanensis]|uniref:lysozyme inhibitor LprI family protein n=1 Tax=Cohnella mopanensis TaxID=2911966 RepID=UPI001EF7C636|nr:lysozyme inhibitor LprI family protein [Cohnella mopanensis]
MKKNIVLLLLLIVFSMMFSGCNSEPKETNINNASNNENESISPTNQTQTKELPKLTDEPTKENKDNLYIFDNDSPTPYKEYIKGLKYLEENDSKSESYYMDHSADMVDITSNSLKAWDKELNKIYSLLIKKLSADDIEKLINEERLWIKERDKLVHDYKPKSKDDVDNAVKYNYWSFFATKNRTLELIHRYYSHDHDKSSALDAYRAVLRNEAKFFSINDSNNVNKEDYLIDGLFNTSDENQPKLHFTVVDMDGDSEPEVVVERFYDGGSENGVVLHYEDGTVYGYLYGAQGIYEIKKDGSYSYSGGDGDGYAKIQFFGLINKYTFLSFHDDGGYQINNVPSTDAEFDNFSEAQKQKENVNWYEVNEDTIASKVEAK